VAELSSWTGVEESLIEMAQFTSHHRQDLFHIKMKYYFSPRSVISENKFK
jgi:hypothetical protein